MDTAKAANVIFVHGGEPREWEGYFGLPRANDGMGRPQELAPLACIPTTCGTGSEMSFAAVIKDRDQHVKFQVADFPMFPRLALLDPEATRTLPPQLVAATGMDAMTHAIEGYVSREWTPHGDAYAMQALRMLRDNLRRAVEHPDDEDARQHADRRQPGDPAHVVRRDRDRALALASRAARTSTCPTASPTRSTCRG